MKYDTWQIKHIQDKPFIALGSLLNAYAQINQGKGIDIEEFKKIADDLFEKAKKYAKDSIVKEKVNDDEIEI